MNFNLLPLPRNLVHSGIVLAGIVFLNVYPSASTNATSDPTTTPAAALSLTAGTERIDRFGIRQVYVPPSCYMMGSDPIKDSQAQANEQPQHQVCITKAFWLDKFDVSNAAFDAFVKAGGYTNDRLWSKDGLIWRQAINLTAPSTVDSVGFDCTLYSIESAQPRVCINYYEAEAYAIWRGGRLPTEAEWEYAARGSTGWIYPWGNVFDSKKANTLENGISQTTAVDAYPSGKSWVGAYDMAGNVRQWVSDWYDKNYYANSPKSDPTGPAVGTTRITRGGSWVGNQDYSRAAYRFDAGGQDFDVGFRLLSVVPG